jgi:hypothetical protein
MTHNQEVVSSNPTIYWMNERNVSYCIKRKRKKGIKMGHTKNNKVLIHDNVIMSTKQNYGFMYGGKYSGCSLM